MAVSPMVTTMIMLCSLWLFLGSCYSAPVILPTSFSPGQVLATLDPFANSQDNLSLTLFLRSENYLSLASLRRWQAHRYDINTTTDYCEIDVGIGGVWSWRSGCAAIGVGRSCSAMLSMEGDLEVVDGGNSVAWSSDTAGKNVQSVEVSNAGDLVLVNSSDGVVWQSSDHLSKEVCNVSATSPGGTPAPASPAPAAPPAPTPSMASPSPSPSPSPAAATTPSPSPSSSPSSSEAPPTAPPSSSPSPSGSSGSASTALSPEASSEEPAAPPSHGSVSGLRNWLPTQSTIISLIATSILLLI